ncbi:uncharacterized protein [Procambarus clarkii]|uniref:uncharacterized protein n=1 Tax=Procambarus clarkii TaxID=6728 RepID=UPI003742028E
MAWRMVMMVTAVMCMVTEAAGDMEVTIRDLFEAPLGVEQGRFFLSYDPAEAFNTSVGFTLPFFSFLQPGAASFEAAGLNMISFGIYGFLSWFMLGAVGVAIYNTAQVTPSSRERSDNLFFSGASLNWLVKESVSRLPDVLCLRSCLKQSICSVYGDSESYGFLILASGIFLPYSPKTPEEQLTEFQKAARYGQEDGSDCPYEYPCVVRPLDLLLYIYDYWYDDPRGRSQVL